MMNLMKKNQNKLNQLIKNPFFKTMAIIILLLLLFFVIVTQTIGIIRLKFQIGDMTETMNDLKNENKVLVEKVEQAQTDKAVESIARKKLGMVTSDETPIKIYEKTEPVYEEKTINSQKKYDVYMSDWYEGLGEWIKDLKDN